MTNHDLDDRVQLALGAWATTDHARSFDLRAQGAALPKQRRTLRPYVELGWWGKLEPDKGFIALADQSLKNYYGF